MSKPGSRKKGEDLAPFFILKVDGTKLEADITNYVSSIEYEHSIKLVDLLKFTVKNPGFMFSQAPDSGPDLGAHKVFQPGNEVDLWMGYGPESAAVYQGHAIVAKHMPLFPQEGMPAIQIRGFDGAFRLMDQSEQITAGKRPKKKAKGKDKAGEKFVEMTHSEMVRAKAEKYGYTGEIEPTTRVDTVIQKKGMTDYQFVTGLAALNDMDFWVDYDMQFGIWVLHWKPPESNKAIYELKYGVGDESTLYWAEPQFGLKDQATNIRVMYFSKKLQQWEFVDVEEDQAGPSMDFKKGAAASRQTPRSRAGGSRVAKHQRDLINEEIKSATRLRLAAAGHTIDVIPDKHFKDAAEASDFAKRWFRARKDHFIIIRGGCVGIEDMKARQVHKLTGLGKRLSGDYRFIDCRHKQTAEGGYDIEFTANKVLE